MTVKLTINNANKDLIKTIKSMAKISKSKVKIQQEEKGIDKAIKSYKKEKDNLKIYKNFEEFEKDLWCIDLNPRQNLENNIKD